MWDGGRATRPKRGFGELERCDSEIEILNRRVLAAAGSSSAFTGTTRDEGHGWPMNSSTGQRDLMRNSDGLLAGRVGRPLAR